MKYFFALSVTVIMLVTLLSCNEGGTEIITPTPTSLTGTVWAGETPRPGDWLTIAFKENNIVIMSFIIDNSTNEWEYTYSDGSGTITILESDPWHPAPNGFTVNGDILTITNYGSHGGASRDFKRYR